MSELVIRHRGMIRDENGKFTGGDPDVTLMTIGVAPGGGISAGAAGHRLDRGRSGEDIACTVYLHSPVPVVENGEIVGHTSLTNDDELTVRDKRYRIIVNDWAMQGRGGLEVLCARGQG